MALQPGIVGGDSLPCFVDIGRGDASMEPISHGGMDKQGMGIGYNGRDDDGVGRGEKPLLTHRTN